MSEYYVSPLGNDRSSGATRASAFATIGAAIKAMAADSAAATTYLLDGIYYLNGSTLSLSAANSGDIITAYPGATPIVSGGTAVLPSDWRVGADGIWTAQLNRSDIAQLVVGGQRQTLARYPKLSSDSPTQAGWLWAQILPSAGNPLRQLAYKPTDFPAGMKPTVGQLVTVFDANNWSNSVLKITAVDTVEHVITFDKAVTYYIGPGSRYFISGSKALLSQPGEWYFDHSTNIIHFYPPPGFAGIGAVVSGNSTLINISDAENITIKGLSFSDAATTARSDALIDTAAVHIRSSSGVSVTGNNFLNVAQGVRISGRSKNNSIASNNFYNLWAQAIAITAATFANRIVHNTIYKVGDVFAAASAVQLENTSHNIVSNNRIHNVPRAGVSDIHSDTAVQSGANVIEHNKISHSGQATDDSGAIYIASFGSASVLPDTIRFNIIDDAGGFATTGAGTFHRNASAGIYVDFGSTGAEIAGNTVQGATIGGVYLQGGSNNDVQDNSIVSQRLPDLQNETDALLVPINGSSMGGNAVYDGEGIHTSSLSASTSSPAIGSSSAIGSGTPGGVSAVSEAGAATPGTLQSSSVPTSALPLTITEGQVAEIVSDNGQNVGFAGGAGTLKLSDGVGFTGEVSGLSGSDAIDLADVSYGADTTVTYLGNTQGGTLTVSDGSHTANIDLVGNYLSSTWDLSSDGSGGTVVVDPVASGDWQTLDVGGGGYVDGIDIAPNGTMVARTDTYGAYIWNGSEWQQLVTATSMPATFSSSANLANAGQGVYEIQIAPSSSNILYMMYEGYVFESSNDGTTWTQTAFAQVDEDPNNSYRGYGQKMAVDPDNPNIVYVGTPENGLFVTTNGGASWQSVSAVPVSQTDGNGTSVDDYPGISGIEFDPALGVTGGKTNTIFAASYGNGVYESTNGGTSWSSIGGPTDVIAAAVSSTGVYYVAADDSSVWSYANGTWTQLVNAGAGKIWTLAVNPLNPNEIVAQDSDGSLLVSYNAGATWGGLNIGLDQLNSTDVPWLADTGDYMTAGGLAFSPTVPNELFSSDGVGVWDTSIPTSGFTWTTVTPWTDQSAGIEQLVANEIIVPPGGVPILASWDRGFMTITNPDAYPTSYGPVNGSFVAGWSLDYASSDPSFIVGLADWYGTEESGYSTNGGQTWTPFPTFIPGAGTDFIGGTIAASTPDNIIWAPANGNQPYYTLDGGETWNPITLPGVTSWSGFDWAYYLDTRTVTADRVLANTFYLYDWQAGLFETTNGGVSWTEVYTGQIGSWSGDNAELLSVPGEAGNLFFASGPQGGAQTGFWQSTNQGATWTEAANVEQVNTFGFGAPAPGQSYPSIYIVGWVNNVYGIWQSTNDAQSWVQIGTYPDNSLDTIKTIAGNPNAYGEVYIGFQGSGYAYLSAAPVVTAVAASPASGTENPGNVLTFTLTMSETVTVTGTPTLTLNDGGTATYSSGSGTDALTFTYVVSPTNSSVSQLAITAANEPNGATVTDASGNNADLSGAVTTFSSLQIDPPSGPAISSITESPSSGDLDAGKTVTFTLTMNEAVTVAGGTPTLTLNDGGTATYTSGSGTSALTFSYTVAAGQNTPDLTATAVNLNTASITDGSGNAATLSLPSTQNGPQIDTTAPSPPVITGDAVNLNDTITLTGTAAANASIDVFSGAAELGTTTANANGAWSFTTGQLAAGSYTFTAQAADAAGNVSAMSNGLDPTIGLPAPPVIAAFSPDTGVVGDDITKATTLTLSGTALANSTVTIFDGTSALGTALASAAGAWSYTTGLLGNGVHTFTATDTVGINTSAASALLTVTVDAVVPPAPIFVADTINPNATITFEGNATPNSTVALFESATELGITTVSGNGTWSYTTAMLSNGTHNFTATDTDVAGDVSAISANESAIIASVVPNAPIILSDAIHGNTVTLDGSAAPNSTLAVFDGSTELGVATASGTGAWTYSADALANGRHTFTVTDTVDDAVSSPSSALTVTVSSTEPSSSNGGGQANRTRPWITDQHGHGAKLIDSATLDNIFGVSKVPESHHHQDDFSAHQPPDPHAFSDSAHPLQDVTASDTETSSSAPGSHPATDFHQLHSELSADDRSNPEDAHDQSPKSHWHSTDVTMPTALVTTEELASTTADDGHHDSGQPNNPEPADPINPNPNGAPNLEYHSIAFAGDGASPHFSGLAAQVADAFVFKSDLGHESPQISHTAVANLNLHALFEGMSDLHADLYASALDSVPEANDPSHVIMQALHTHIFHLG